MVVTWPRLTTLLAFGLLRVVSGVAPDETAAAVVLTGSIPLVAAGGEQYDAPVAVRADQDASAAAVVFAEANRLRTADPVLSVTQKIVRLVASASPPVEPPEGLRLRSAGAHKKKAEELSKGGAYDEAAAHLLRALLREGLEEPVMAELKRKFDGAMERLGNQRRLEAEEAAENALAAKRAEEEAAALQEARARAARDDADWEAYVAGQAASVASEGGAVRTALPLRLRSAGEGEGSEGAERQLRVLEGQDAAGAVFAFCSEHGLHSADEVTKLGELVGARLVEGGDAEHAAAVASGASTPPLEHVERGHKERKQGRVAAAGALYARALQHPEAASQLSDAHRREAREGVVAMMQAESRYAPLLASVREGRWEEATAELEKHSRAERSSPRVQLLEARVHQRQGRWGAAQRAAATVVEATATYSSWERGQPRMLAVSLGTAASLELGDGKKALGFLSSVLKYDPDQSEVRVQYKQLKEVLKLMEEAETQLSRRYNHKAVKILDDVLAKLRGMNVANSLFRAQILLKLCRARSSMSKHEEALNNCQTAYRALSEPGPGVHVSPVRVREALEARAFAHENDKNFDDAVLDLRAALELAGPDKAPELQGSLRRVQDLQRRWKCVDPSDRKAWSDNQCGRERKKGGRVEPTRAERSRRASAARRTRLALGSSGGHRARRGAPARVTSRRLLVTSPRSTPALHRRPAPRQRARPQGGSRAAAEPGGAQARGAMLVGDAAVSQAGSRVAPGPLQGAQDTRRAQDARGGGGEGGDDQPAPLRRAKLNDAPRLRVRRPCLYAHDVDEARDVCW